MGKNTIKTSSSSQQQEPVLRALVKWLNGAEAGQFTHNVLVSWILNFDPDSDFRHESHVVKWKVPPKPKSGWPLFDCEVLEISGEYSNGSPHVARFAFCCDVTLPFRAIRTR